jgi:molybdenum cofactor cytidylyltransferase
LPDPRAIAAIVLAAGASSRFGSDKLLHPVTLHGVTMPLAAHSLLPWLETFGQITVVVRQDSQALCNAAVDTLGTGRSEAIRWLVCADAAQGMASSLACGVRANRDAGGWLIGLADMPRVPSAAIAGVRNALLAGANLAAASCEGRRGHPVGFASHYLEELLALEGDKGARLLLEREIANVLHIQTDNDGIFADIDTPGDLNICEIILDKERC